MLCWIRYLHSSNKKQNPFKNVRHLRGFWGIGGIWGIWGIRGRIGWDGDMVIWVCVERGASLVTKCKNRVPKTKQIGVELKIIVHRAFVNVIKYVCTYVNITHVCRCIGKGVFAGERELRKKK